MALEFSVEKNNVTHLMCSCRAFLAKAAECRIQLVCVHNYLFPSPAVSVASPGDAFAFSARVECVVCGFSKRPFQFLMKTVFSCANNDHVGYQGQVQSPHYIKLQT